MSDWPILTVVTFLPAFGALRVRGLMTLAAICLPAAIWRHC